MNEHDAIPFIDMGIHSLEELRDELIRLANKYPNSTFVVECDTLIIMKPREEWL
jgi:hypothetical protein